MRALLTHPVVNRMYQDAVDLALDGHIKRLERILDVMKDIDAIGVFVQGRTPGVAVRPATAARELLEDLLGTLTTPSPARSE